MTVCSAVHLTEDPGVAIAKPTRPIPVVGWHAYFQGPGASILGVMQLDASAST